MVLDIRPLNIGFKDTDELSIKDIAELAYPLPVVVTEINPDIFFQDRAITHIPINITNYNQLTERKNKRSIDYYLERKGDFLKFNADKANRWYVLLLMSDLPKTGPKKGVIYLEKQANQLKYIVITSQGNEVVDFLDMHVEQLTKASLERHRVAIIRETSKRGHINTLSDIDGNCPMPAQNEILFTCVNQTIYYELIGSNLLPIFDSINFTSDEKSENIWTFLMNTAVSREQIQPEHENATPDYAVKRYELEQKLILACKDGQLKYYGPLKEIRYLSWEEYGIKHVEFTGDPEANLLENIEPYSRITAIFCDVDTANMNNKECWSGKNSPKHKQIYKKMPNQCLIQQRDLKYFSVALQNEWFREKIKNTPIEESFSHSEIIDPTPLDFPGLKNKWRQEYNILITSKTILPLLRKGYFGAYVVIDKTRQKTENVQTYIEDKLAKSLWDKAVSAAIKKILESNSDRLEDFILHFEEYREALFKASLEPLIDRYHLHSDIVNYDDIQKWQIYLYEYSRTCVFRGKDSSVKKISGLSEEIDLNNLSQRLEDPILKMQILVYLAEQGFIPSKVNFSHMLKRFPQILGVFKRTFLEQSNLTGLECFITRCENRPGEIKDTIVRCKANLPTLEEWVDRTGKDIDFYKLCLDKLNAFIEKYAYLLKKYDNYERLPIVEETDILSSCRSWSIENIINKESPLPNCTCGFFVNADKEIMANKYTNKYPPLASERLFIEQCHSCENLYFFSDQLERFERTVEFKELVLQFGGYFSYTEISSEEKVDKNKLSIPPVQKNTKDKIYSELVEIILPLFIEPKDSKQNQDKNIWRHIYNIKQDISIIENMHELNIKGTNTKRLRIEFIDTDNEPQSIGYTRFRAHITEARKIKWP